MGNMHPGPPKKPTALRILQGNASNRPLPEHEAAPPAAEPHAEPPFPLGEAAQKIWDQMCPMLRRIGLLTVCDLGVLARYCDMFVMWVRARDFIDANGDTFIKIETYREFCAETKVWVLKERNGPVCTNPQTNVYLSLSRELTRLENELGLTPAARTRISVEVFNKDSLKDEMTAYLASNPRKQVM